MTTAQWLLTAIFLQQLIANFSLAAPLDEDDEEFRPGLVAEYREGERTVTRIDPDVAFAWDEVAPDARLSAERFEGTWRGLVLIRLEAKHRLHAFVQGDVTVELDGKRVLHGSAKQPQWISGDEFVPGFAERPLVVTFRKTEQTAQLKLFWSSDSFGLEPLPPELLFHDDTSFNPNAIGVGAKGKPTPDRNSAHADGVAVKQSDEALALIERGRQQFAAFRCGRCHVREGDSVAPAAPALQHVAAGMTIEQIAKRLAPALNSSDATASDRRMPHFHLNEEQARHLAKFLVQQSEPVKLDEPKPLKTKPPKEGEVVVTPQRRGEVLFRSVGCLACHRLGELGNSNDLPFAGPELTHVGQRRSAAWLTTWLSDPKRLNVDHRMPVFALTDEEQQLIVAALSESDASAKGSKSPVAKPAMSEMDVETGRKLFVEFRCAACHQVTDKKLADFIRPKVDLSQPIADWSKSCWSDSSQPPAISHQPSYSGLDSEAIKAFLASRWNRPLSRESQFVRGTRMLEEKNCFACHPRHGGVGLGSTAKLVASADKELNGQAPSLVAPSLNSIGDKLLDEALSIAVRGERQPIRMPWLKVRMPKFKHSPDELATLTRYFVEHDRIPPMPSASGGRQPPGASEAARDPTRGLTPPARQGQMAADAQTHLAGQALTGVRGWSCIACHKIGDYEPKQVALGARGSDLKMLGKHIRPEFFFRWIASPLRVIPGVEMPQYNRPVAGVLDGDLAKQHAALWQALNDPNFQPPTNPANVEQLFVVNPGERPRIVRDVFSLPKELGGGTVPRSFAVGFDNGHSLLFDLDTVSLRQWTFGDFARQQAIGKRWLWEMAGLPLGGFGPDSTLALRRTTELKAPARSPTGLIGLQYTSVPKDPSVHLWYTLLFGGNQLEDAFAEKAEQILFGKVEHVLMIQETLTPLTLPDSNNGTASTGVERKLEIKHSVGSGGVAPLDLLVRRPLSVNAVAAAKSEIFQFEKRVADDEWKKLPLDQSNDKDWMSIRIQPFETVRVTLRYMTSLPQSQLTTATKLLVRSPKQSVSSVPGFDGWQLPVDSSIMPTAMTWSRDGKLAFTSLKGHAFVARDTDGDALEDELKLVEEGLAAPYGILGFLEDQKNSETPDGDLFLIAHKPELLVVTNVDSGEMKGGRQRFNLATGWGYNDDYHDWTSGILRDSQGRLLIGLGSDYTDKNRPASKSRWRGKVLRIDGRALNKFVDGGGSTKGASEKFITPVGHAFRYPTGLAISEWDEVFVSDQQGVQNCFNEINYLVEGAHYGVPSTHEEDKDAPETKAAIQIPHPWTRSVNGLVFLTGKEGYPDLKGHGIGCEYNGRFLIRFSTQRVGDVMQGAVYPFSMTDDELVRGLAAATDRAGATNAIEVSGGKPAAPRQKTVPNFEGPLCCGVSPKGEIYIGSIADSGWAGGQNTGSIVKLKGNGQRPNGIREIRATRDGFDIDFFAPVDRARATNGENYSISGYTRVWGGAYATPDSDRHRCKVLAIELSDDGRTAKLKVDSRKTPNYVYDISCRGVAEPGKPLWPDYGFFTLHKIPSE